ncbi:MAG: Zn-dependent hydrolase [Gemmatimonadales bacterium]|nr:Zn-dependent hydrolase [Gemmatimonadales bacterium]
MRRMIAIAAALSVACGSPDTPDAAIDTTSSADSLLAAYTSVRLEADLSALTDAERQMIPLLIDAAQAMDEVYWLQMVGPRDSVLAAVSDPKLRQFVDINYGPWDRLNGEAPFIDGTPVLPPGKNFYPHDITKEEFEAAAAAAPDGGESLRSLYTLVQRDSARGLVTVPYHVAYRAQSERAAGKLREAAAIAEDPGLKKYLTLRADALLNDDYPASDIAWLDMKNNGLDVVIGPIETYDDQLFGYKAAHEAFVLIKDREWSARLAKYAAMLPGLQRDLPVEPQFKREKPGTDSDLNAYDVVYYAGQSNSGSKTIAINLPNDEAVQLQKGTRRLQLKNAMRAKFDRILVPIANVLIAEDQRPFVTFDAFFENTMFHEVAHGLGIKNSVKGTGTVREALKERASALEEGKADVLGLYMISRLNAAGELQGDVRDNFVTFIAGIFRSVRFGASSAHGRANVARFNFFSELGAFVRDSASGTYRVDLERMPAATDSLSATIIRFQGNGDYAGVSTWMEKYGVIGPQLQADLDRLGTAGIPVDVVFEQGVGVLGLK